jgi:hypothetical protein
MPLHLHYEVYKVARIYESPIGLHETIDAEYRIVSLGREKSLDSPLEDEEFAQELEIVASETDRIFRIVSSDQSASLEDVASLMGEFSADTLEMLSEKKEQIASQVAFTYRTLHMLSSDIEKVSLKLETIGDFHADRNWFMRKGQLEMELAGLYSRHDRLTDRLHALKLQLIDVERSFKVCKRRDEI